MIGAVAIFSEQWNVATLTAVSDTMPTEQPLEKPDKPALAATELA
jgi:hypothetical protein